MLQAIQALLEERDLLAQRVQLALRASQERQGQLEPQDQRGLLVARVLREQPEARVPPDLLVQLVKQVSLGRLGQLEVRGRPERRGPLEVLARQGQPERQVPQGQLGSLDQQGPPEQLAQPDRLEQRVRLGSQEVLA